MIVGFATRLRLVEAGVEVAVLSAAEALPVVPEDAELEVVGDVKSAGGVDAVWEVCEGGDVVAGEVRVLYEGGGDAAGGGPVFVEGGVGELVAYR
jgi:hypothetical protein